MCNKALFRPRAYSLLQSITELDCRHRSGNRSHGVCSPTAFAALEARSSRVCLARHRPSSGFRTLLTVCVFRSLPAVFHASNAHGVIPSGPFPLAEPEQPLGRPCLRGVSQLDPCVSEAETPSAPFNPASPSRLCSPQGFVTCRTGLTSLEGRCPLGFLPSRDFLSDAAQHLRAGSPPELSPRLRPKTHTKACSPGS